MAPLVIGTRHTERMHTSQKLLRIDQVSKNNCEKFERQHARRHGPTPEMFIAKHIDNTRLIKADDPVCRREMVSFTLVMSLLFALTMIYVWQHFSAIEIGYNVEAQKLQVEQMREENQELRISEAELSDPRRIDNISKQLGMNDPRTDQVTRQDEANGNIVAQGQSRSLPDE